MLEMESSDLNERFKSSQKFSNYTKRMLKSEIRRLIQTRLIQILLYKQDLTEPKEDRGEKNEDHEDEASNIKKKKRNQRNQER